MEKFRELLIQYKFEKRLNKTSTEIQQIENIINFNLPMEYKYFLENYLEFENFIGPEYVILWDIDKLIEYNTDYTIFENLPNTLAIGSNGASEFLAIEFINENNYRIVISPTIDVNKEYHIEVGKSFSDFIDRLDNDIEWFSK